jgi:hypothetical protein
MFAFPGNNIKKGVSAINCNATEKHPGHTHAG